MIASRSSNLIASVGEMYLYIDKPDTMQAEKVHIKAKNLIPHETYKIVLKLKHDYGTHMAYAVFKADASGEIDVPTAKPLRGTYDEADPMGLFMSIRPCEDFPFGGYLKCTPPLPFIYNLIIFDAACRQLDMIPIKKHWMHPKLIRTEIEVDGFCGTLFQPPGDGPYPCVIDISGTGGGLHEHKGSMLASEGFVVLCLAFFQYKNLVYHLTDVEISYFEKPIKWLLAQPFTNSRLGIQGVSFGATIVNILATRYPQINAVVSINGPHVQNKYANIKENGELLVEAPTDDSHLYFINGVMASEKIIQYLVIEPNSEIPWERIPKSTAFRLVASVDDLVASSVFSNRYMHKKLRETGHEVEIQLLNGGHIMEPPYFPHHDLVYARYQGFCCGYGGDVVLHGKSQEISWKGTIDFFRRKLGEPVRMPDWERVNISQIKSSL